MLNPSNPKIKENLPKIKEIIMNKNVTLFFIPSQKLKRMVSDPKHPMFKDMPNRHKAALLTGEGIFIQKKMVWDWISGKLDQKNSFVLSNGDIRVFDDNYKIIEQQEKTDD